MRTLETALAARVRHGAPPPTTRGPRVRRSAAWAFLLVATLVFKSFVPLLAAASADLQGKAVADVCALYGVRMPQPAESAHHGAAHAMGHMHGVAMAGMDVVPSPSQHHPSEHAEHSRDHCALSGLAVGAAFALTLWGPVDWRAAPVPGRASADDTPPWRDASARWLTLRVHAPPRRA